MQESNTVHLPRLKQLQPLKPFLQETIYSTDPDTALTNETEVWDASKSVLVEPVIRGLKGLFNLRIRCRREQSAKMIDGGTSRLDVVWEYCEEDGLQDDWKPFALMEYKNTNIIQEKSFIDRIYGRAKDGDGSLISSQRLLQTAGDEDVNSLLRSNTMGLVKTARWYGSRLPHVVMFDWDTMATFDFTEFDFKITSPTKPNPVRMDVFQETQEALAQDKSFGRLLLGFLAHALKYTISRSSQGGA